MEKLANTVDIMKAIEEFGRISVSYNDCFSSIQITSFSDFTDYHNYYQSKLDYKLFYRIETFRKGYFCALNGAKCPDLSNDKSLD